MPQPGFFQLFREQINPPSVTHVDLTGKTVIVIGANAGIGFEATKHFASMNPGKLILACRSQEKGEAVLAEIRENVGCQTAEMWSIDMSKFASVIEFAERVENECPRLDIVVLNAAIYARSPEFTDDGWEATYETNYMSGSLLALLLVPRMINTAECYSTTPRLTFVSSGGHYMVKSLDKKAMDSPNPLRFMAHKDQFTQTMAKSYSPHTVYGATKVMSHFFVRALNDRLDRKPLVVCSADPGMCATTILHRHNEGLASFVLALLYRTVGRTAEEGSRPIVWGAVGGEEKKDEMRGGYVSTVAKVDMPSDFIMSEKGHIAQEKLWYNLLEELRKISPKVEQIVQQYLTPYTS